MINLVKIYCGLIKKWNREPQDPDDVSETEPTNKYEEEYVRDGT